MKDSDGIDLPQDDFRRSRKYLAPWLFAWPGDEPDTYPPPSDLVPEDRWDNVMTLPTDVALKSSSYEGSIIARLSSLCSDWISSWPRVGEAPFLEETSLLAGEEFDALVFNALHGYYRQAIGCLRNALETMTIAASLAVTRNQALFDEWRQGARQISFGQARAWLRDSTIGAQVEHEATPYSVFGNDDAAWMKARYARLCAYAHSQAGYNNADFWESNGPVFSRTALHVVECEFRETAALAYFVLRLAWPGFQPGPIATNLLSGPTTGWDDYHSLLSAWLVPGPSTEATSLD